MPRPKGITDDQFLVLLKKGLSPAELCRTLDITWGANTKQRIEKICEANGINYKLLRTGHDRSPEEKREKLFRIHDRERVVSLEIENGSILVGTAPNSSRLASISAAHRAFCNVLSEHKSQIKGVVLNGDIADFAAPSRFPRGPWRNPTKPLIKDELEAVQQRCSEIESVAPKGSFFLRTLGNHDDRFESKLSACMPEAEGLLGTRLRDHIPRWTEAERIDANGDTEWIHNIRSGEVGRDRQNVFATGHNTFVGHSHQLHVYPQTWRRGTYYGVCCGTLADLDDEVFHYLGSRPANWQSGFVLASWVDGILLRPEMAEVTESKSGSEKFLYFRGKRYA